MRGIGAVQQLIVATIPAGTPLTVTEISARIAVPRQRTTSALAGLVNRRICRRFRERGAQSTAAYLYEVVPVHLAPAVNTDVEVPST